MESSDPVNLKDLVYTVRDAVVLINGYDPTGINLPLQGNGFFVKGHYIICPSYLVQIPETRNLRRVLVTISNVETSGKSYVYEANVIGIDGAGNIAVLRINNELIWNRYNPVIREHHPFLSWGKSRNCAPGERIFLIASSSNSENAVLLTNIADNRYVDYEGLITGELLLFNSIVLNTIGAPVINYQGKLIAMQIKDNMALSEFFMRRPIKALIKAFLQKPGNNINVFSIGNCHYYAKSYLGVKGRLLVPDADYLLKMESREESKEVVGYEITDSGGLVDLTSGDIVTHLNGCALGDRRGQIAPALLMWRVLPGEFIKVKFWRKRDNYREVELELPTSFYNEVSDFPWYYQSENPHKNIILF